MQIRPAKPEDATAIADYILLAMQDLAFNFLEFLLEKRFYYL